MKLNLIKFQIVKFIKKNSKYILVSCIVLIVAYIIYNFVFIKEDMIETMDIDYTPGYYNKDVGACASALGVMKDGSMDGNIGDHNPVNRFNRFKNTLNDKHFQMLLQKSKPEYKKTDIKKYDIEYYFNFGSGVPTPEFYNLTNFTQWEELDNDTSLSPQSVTQHLLNQISSTCEKYNKIKNLNNPKANRNLPSFSSGNSSVATYSGANMSTEEIKKENDEYQAYLKSQNGDSSPGVEVDDDDQDDEDDQDDQDDQVEDGDEVEYVDEGE